MKRYLGPLAALVVTLTAPAAASAATLELVTSWGSDGAGDGQFSILKDVAVGPGGDVYTIEDGGGVSSRVQRFDATGRFIAKTGSEGAGPGQFQDGAALDVGSDGVVFAVDAFNDRVTRFDPTLSSLVGSPWGSSGFGTGQFRNPEGIAVLGADVVYVADRGNNQIDRYTADGAVVSEIGGSGTGPGQFNRVVAAAVDRSGDVYAVDRDNNRVQRFSPTGAFVRAYGLGSGNGPGQLRTPLDVAVDASGSVWITDANLRVQKFGSDGAFLAAYDRVGTLAINPEGIAFGPSGDLYIADFANRRVVRARTDGQPPAPVAFRSANARPISGTVLVYPPGSSTPVELTAQTRIAVGSKIDVRGGTVGLDVALTKAGKIGSGAFTGGIFRLARQRAKGAQLVTDLALRGGSFGACPRPGRAAAARRRAIRYLSAKAHGRFNVIGRRSSGVERGTTWTTSDRCDGTLTQVKSGSVAVTDFARRRTVVVRAGRSYLATGR